MANSGDPEMAPMLETAQSNVGTTTATLKWNRVYLISCVVALLVDPLFLYIPIINQDMKCIGLDQNLKIATLLLRSAVDLPCIVHIIYQIFAATREDHQRSGRVKRISYLRISYWLIDILAILPIPHVVILILLTRTRGSKSLKARNFLNFLVIFQYVPRAFRMYRSCKEANRPADNWNGLCLKLYKFIFPSHVSGAIWYYCSIQREMDCWQYACRTVNKCEAINFGCAGNTFKIDTFLNVLCPINIPNSAIFDFGIFLEALQSGIMGSTDFPQKFLHCFWWGLRSLSSLGQNLQTSNYAWENIFALCISITGILLFLIYLNEIVQEFKTHHSTSTPPPESLPLTVMDTVTATDTATVPATDTGPPHSQTILHHRNVSTSPPSPMPVTAPDTATVTVTVTDTATASATVTATDTARVPATDTDTTTVAVRATATTSVTSQPPPASTSQPPPALASQPPPTLASQPRRRKNVSLSERPPDPSDETRLLRAKAKVSSSLKPKRESKSDEPKGESKSVIVTETARHHDRHKYKGGFQRER